MSPEGFDAETTLAVWAARETGLLEAYLREAGTPRAAAETAGVTEEAARVIGRVLAEAELLTETDEGYEPTNGALGLLTTRDARSIGSLPARLDTIDALTELPETMTTGVPPRDTRAHRESARVHAVGAREATDAAVVRACVTAAIRAAPDAERVLDVAGGAGTYAAEFTTRGLDATVQDAPNVCERFGSLLEARGLGVTTDALDAVGEPFDVVFWADGPTRMDAPEAAATLVAASDAVADGGTLVVIDRFGDTAADVRGLATGGGGGHETARVREWCLEAGLSPRIRPVPGTDREAVVAHAE